MPDISDFAKLPYPTGPDTPDIPGRMMALVEALDQKVVLPAVSIGERDSLYGSLQPGAIVATTQAPWYVWLRTRVSESVLGWATLYEDIDWQPIPTSAWRPGWTDLEVGGVGASGWNRHNGRVEVYIRATYSGDPVTASSSGGNISDIPVVDLPSSARPLKGQAPGAFLASTPGMVNISVAGLVSITHLFPGGTLDTNTVLTYTDNWRR